MNWLPVFRLFRKAPDSRRQSPRRCPATFRPRLEALEDRWVPSTLAVTSPLDDVNVQGTLRYDIAHAANGDTILITPALHGTPIVLTQGELYLNKDVTIEGLSNHSATISGNHSSQVFDVAAGAQVTLKDLNITAGSSGVGGGIFNGGTLTISDSILSGNTALSGGGIFNRGFLTISNSTLADNTAGSGGTVVGSGGGIYNAGSVTISNSTLADNTAFFGGGIFGSNLTISNSTLADNTASFGGGIYNFGGLTTISNSILSGNASVAEGGGIFNSGFLTVSNSTLADNTALEGGGIYNFENLTISNTDFCHNHPDDIAGFYTDGGGNTFC